MENCCSFFARWFLTAVIKPAWFSFSSKLLVRCLYTFAFFPCSFNPIYLLTPAWGGLFLKQIDLRHFNELLSDGLYISYWSFKIFALNLSFLIFLFSLLRSYLLLNLDRFIWKIIATWKSLAFTVNIDRNGRQIDYNKAQITSDRWA